MFSSAKSIIKCFCAYWLTHNILTRDSMVRTNEWLWYLPWMFFDYFITSEAQKVADTIQVKIFAKYDVRKIEQYCLWNLHGIFQNSMDFFKSSMEFQKFYGIFIERIELFQSSMEFSKIPVWRNSRFHGILENFMEFLKSSMEFWKFHGMFTFARKDSIIARCKKHLFQ